MDFKFKTRLGRTWNTEGLSNILEAHYPGSKTLQDAITKERELIRSGVKEVLPLTQPEPFSREPSPTQLEPKPSPIKARLPYADTDQEF